MPFLVGSNAHEGTIFLRQMPVQRPTGCRWIVRGLYGGSAEELLRLFPAQRDEDVQPALNTLTS